MEKEIKTIAEKLRICSKELSLNCKVELEDDMLTLKFSEEPKPEIVKQIEEMVFFTNEIIMSNIRSNFADSGKAIMIDLKNYPIFCRIYESLKSFKCNIFMVEIMENELVFAYTLKHKHDLCADELDILQNIINSNIKNHDSIRVSYDKGVSTMRVDLAKTEEHLD